MPTKTMYKTKKELLNEIENLRLRLADAEDTLRAIGSGEVDGFIVSGAGGEQIFTLRGAEYPYRVLVETMNEGAATLAADGTIVYCNNRLAVLLQVPLERIIGTRFDSYVAPVDKSLFAARLSRYSEECDNDEVNLVTSNGKYIPVILSYCHRDQLDDQRISLVVTNLSQQKRNEEFFASGKLARSIIEQAGEIIIVCDQAGRIINASCLANEYCEGNPLLKLFDEAFQLFKTETGEPIFFTELSTAVNFRNIEVTINQGGKPRLYLILNSTLLHGAEMAVLGCVVTLTDITVRKQTEELVKTSLAEKEVLLREIHHRVKNNLQVISSLVSLQSDNLTDKRTRDELDDVRDRVRSMALIHEKLYQTSNLRELNFADYAASLLHFLWRSHGILAERVRLTLALETVALSIDAAVPCGLILNELAGNALKHAFPDKNGGEVTVGLQYDAATDAVCLRVHDNGVGLPAGLDWRQCKSLGLRLVRILAGQLRGTVETVTGTGTEFRVVFCLKGFRA
jgi:two-component sensor histidine kinase/PAS domain-containing protein